MPFLRLLKPSRNLIHTAILLFVSFVAVSILFIELQMQTVQWPRK